MDVHTVDPTNAAQAQAWDGDEGTFWAANADRFDAAIAAYTGRLFDAATITPADVVLDVGCGTGETTREAARRAHEGHALGIDLSSQMLDVARARAEQEGCTNVAFVQGDAQVHPFASVAFDLVVSRTGTMFFGDRIAAFTNLAQALRPGGRMVQLVWQGLEANTWIASIRTALAAGRDLPVPPPEAPSPFALSDPARVQPLLEHTGFEDVSFQGVEAPMRFGDDADDAYAFVLGTSAWMLDGLDEDAKAQAREALHALMAAHETPDGVHLGSAAWIVTARRAG